MVYVMRVYGDWPVFGANLKWPLKELAVLFLFFKQTYFSALEFASWNYGRGLGPVFFFYYFFNHNSEIIVRFQKSPKEVLNLYFGLPPSSSNGSNPLLYGSV